MILTKRQNRILNLQQKISEQNRKNKQQEICLIQNQLICNVLKRKYRVDVKGNNIEKIKNVYEKS